MESNGRSLNPSASETTAQPHSEENVNDESMPSDRDATPGVQVNAGDSFYIPAGGLRIWNNEDGTLGFGLTAAVDPWLPDLSGDRGTPLDAMDSILGGGFPVSTICNRGTIHGCQKSQDVRALIVHPTIQRLSHMVVVHEQRAVGVLDLDLARGKFRHKESDSSLLVEEVYEPASDSNSMRAETYPSRITCSRRIGNHSGSSSSTVGSSVRSMSKICKRYPCAPSF